MLAGNVFDRGELAVIDDREHYHTSKYLVTAPTDGLSYLLGRGSPGWPSPPSR